MRSEIRPAVFAVCDDKKKGKGREGTQSHKTLCLAIRGADTPRPITIKFGTRVAPAT